MKRLGFLHVVAVAMMVLSGCQMQNRVAQSSTDALGSLSPVGSYSVKRQHHFILPYDSSFYIANPINNIITNDGSDVNALFAKKLKTGFSKHFARVYIGLNKERFAQALRSSKEMGAQFMIYGYVEKWSNIGTVQDRLCNEYDPNCPQESEDGDDASGEGNISVSIYEAATGRLVDIVSVTSQRGMASYVYEDIDGPLDQVVTSMMETLTTQR